MAGDGLARGVELSSSSAMSRMAFLTRVFAFSHVVPPSLSSGWTRAGVFLDEIEPLDRDEELVVAGIPQLHELLLRLPGAEGNLPEADERADAVVHVDDEVADLEVAQIGEKRLGRRAAALFRRATVFVEDIGLGVDRQRRARKPEAARQPPHRDDQRRRVGVLGAFGRRGDDW